MQERVRAVVRETLIAGGLVPDGGLPEFAVEAPRRPEHGDFACNAALVLAGRLGRKPREVAQAIAGGLRDPEGLIESVEVAGPGFLNLRLRRDGWLRALGEVLAAGPDWGRGPARDRPRVCVESPSPNPTGPMHVGTARIAAVGDAVARVLAFAGFAVVRECYVNDHGSKIDKFAASIVARAQGREPPPDGYRGEYVRGIARRAAERGVPLGDAAAVAAFGVSAMLDRMREDLARFGVAIDVWSHERDLYARGEVARAIAALRERGLCEERDGALFFRTRDAGEDDQDRVLVRRTGEPTYFAADLAYHLDKRARGLDTFIDVWGADHHGAIPRLRAGLSALGVEPERLEILLVQLVALLRGGEKVAMDKSAGEFVTLAELCDEVGADAARFFFLLRRHDTSFDFDLDLARRRSLDNPVYYVQYAHARCRALARRAAELGLSPPAFSLPVARRLALDEEIAVVRRLAGFPDLVRGAAETREPHRIAAFALDLARDFQSYYTRLQKVHDDPILPQRRHREGDWRAAWDADKTHARLWWVEAIRTVLATALGLLGVSAPDRLEPPESPCAEAGGEAAREDDEAV